MTRLIDRVKNNAVAYTALFVALGGTGAYAADTIGSEDVINNSLRSEDISDASARQPGTGISRLDLQHGAVSSEKILEQTIQAEDIAGNAVGAAQLADDSVTKQKVAEGAIGEPELATGAVTSRVLGPNSAGSGTIINGTLRGEDIQPGTIGIDSLREMTLHKVVKKHKERNAPWVTARCPDPTAPGAAPIFGGIAGGARISSEDDDIGLAGSHPEIHDGVMRGWTAQATKGDDKDWVRITVYITCIRR